VVGRFTKTRTDTRSSPERTTPEATTWAETFVPVRGALALMTSKSLAYSVR
jgi:hypothetical protein